MARKFKISDYKAQLEPVIAEVVTPIIPSIIDPIIQARLNSKVDKVTGKSLVTDTEIPKIHALNTDNQDLSGLVEKVTGKGLSTNDYTTAEQSKLSGIEEGANNYTHPAYHSQSEVLNLVTDLAGKEPANVNIQTHVTSAHAPSDAQKNSNILKSEIETKLTGEITSHSHAGGGGGLTQAQILTRML